MIAPTRARASAQQRYTFTHKIRELQAAARQERSALAYRITWRWRLRPHSVPFLCRSTFRATVPPAADDATAALAADAGVALAAAEPVETE